MLSVSLHLEGEHALVVGGGPIAARRVLTLLSAGLRVRVISPELCDELLALTATGQIEFLSRKWSPGDGEGAALVVAATGDSDIDRAIAKEARARGRLVNVTSGAGLGSLSFASEIRRGPLRVSVSTSGLAPGISRRMRRHLEGLIGAEWGLLAEWYASVRERLHSIPGLTRPDRAAVLEALVDGPLLDLLAAGQSTEAERYVDELIQSASRK